MIFPRGSVFILYVVVAEFLSTYLIHCPAHYIVGLALGIRFARVKLGRTTLARALPSRFSSLARVFPVITLTTDRSSLAKASSSRIALMYASGTVASVGAAFAVAAAVTPGASVALILVSWTVAFLYFFFDLVFSPRTGDLMRARAALRPRPVEEPVQTEE
jgi:hypothetical protein